MDVSAGISEARHKNSTQILMTISDFRKHKYLPSQWKKEMQTNGILQAVIQVLEDAHPSRYPIQTNIQDDISPTKATLDLGFTRGYSAVLNTVRILAEPVITMADVGEPQYAPEPVGE